MVIRLGVIGGGKFGVNHLRAFKQAEYTQQAKLVALADVNSQLLEERKREFGMKGYIDYKEMLDKEDLDAVSIATPDHLHREIAITAINRGQHVLIEKPLDITVEGCEEIIIAARKNKVLAQVDFHKRFDQAHLELKREVDEGKLGKIEYGYVHMEDRIEVPTEWFPGWAPKSSPAWFLGVHFYDLVRWILNSNAKKVYAKGRKEKLLEEFNINTYDSIQAMIEFENGAVIYFDTSWILPKSFEAIVNQGLRLVGTKGIWEVDTQNRGVLACNEINGIKTVNPFFIMEYKDEKGRNRYTGYGIDSIADFVKNVNYLKERNPLEDLQGKYASAEDGMEVTKMAVAVHSSIEKGVIVEVG